MAVTLTLIKVVVSRNHGNLTATEKFTIMCLRSSLTASEKRQFWLNFFSKKSEKNVTGSGVKKLNIIGRP